VGICRATIIVGHSARSRVDIRRDKTPRRSKQLARANSRNIPMLGEVCDAWKSGENRRLLSNPNPPFALFSQQPIKEGDEKLTDFNQEALHVRTV
jgi:hypothetical protein